ncbi:FAD-dependent oxidoreductase [Rhodococcus sp. NPDC055112]
MENVDVVVVGGGPTGLTIAGDLSRAGREVAVLERWPQINPSSRAFATMARTLEVLDSRNLADGLLDMGTTIGLVHLFGGATLDLTRLPSRYRYALITPQTNVDQALARYACEQGAVIHRGTEVIGLEQESDGVTVTAQPKGGGVTRSWRARYVVGADGAHSTVRELLGAPFPGKTVLQSVVLADVRLANGPGGGGPLLGSTANEFAFLVPYGDDGWYRSVTWDRNHRLPDSAPVEPGEIEEALDRALGRTVGLGEISWRSRFHCDERQVENYRHGRVFLGGDAAHVHSPMGGQGMNTGIQDGANLAWKLDLALGGADDAILDTYQSERHPIGRLVLFQSGALMRAVTLKPVLARRARDFLVPKTLEIRPISNLISGAFSGVTLRYRHARGQHSLVGTRATEVPLRRGRLTEVQRTPGFVLVRRRGATNRDSDVLQAERTDAGPDLLVRPDGYIAWAGTTAGDGGWRTALQAWTGAAA